MGNKNLERRKFFLIMHKKNVLVFSVVFLFIVLLGIYISYEKSRGVDFSTIASDLIELFVDISPFIALISIISLYLYKDK